jgi:hypothetical protein
VSRWAGHGAPRWLAPVLAAWIAAAATGLLALAAAAPALAVTVPCAGVAWGSCDTRATDRGYQYRYVGGEFIPVRLGGSGPAAAGCGANCPPDPAAVCDLLLSVGPSPDMTPAELAQYNQAIAGCQTWLSGPGGGVPVATVTADLTTYLRERLLPKPTLTIQPTTRSYTGLATLVYTPVPPAFAFDVDQPVLATISAVPTYHWAFGDGTVGPNAPGRPYDPAIPPGQYPDAYVSHVYQHTGTYQVTLTVTWAGTFTVPGVAQAFPLQAVTLTAAVPVVVAEAAGVLVGNR